MKGKYITLQIRMACMKKPVNQQKLHQEIEKTIREHQRIMRQFVKPAYRSANNRNPEPQYFRNHLQTI